MPSLQVLLSEGAEVNRREKVESLTPLMAASQCGHDAIVTQLISSGSFVNAHIKATGWTAIMLAVLNNQVPFPFLSLLPSLPSSLPPSLLHSLPRSLSPIISLSLPYPIFAVCVDNSTQKWKSDKKQRRPHHVSVTRWTRGGHGDLSWKFWSGEKIGPGDQNSRNNGPPGPFSPEKFGPDLE